MTISHWTILGNKKNNQLPFVRKPYCSKFRKSFVLFKFTLDIISMNDINRSWSHNDTINCLQLAKRFILYLIYKIKMKHKNKLIFHTALNENFKKIRLKNKKNVFILNALEWFAQRKKGISIEYLWLRFFFFFYLMNVL